MRARLAAAPARVGILAGVVVTAAAGFAPAAHAETMYVIEQLVVSVNATADGSGERVGQLKSAESVEVIERQDDQAHVRLPSGQEGWVKASYLSPSLPLQQQLSTRTEELERLRKDKAQLETELAAARRAAKDAAAAPAPAAAPAIAAAAPVTEAPPPAAAAPDSSAQGAPPLFAENSMMPKRPTWPWTLGFSILSLAVGFALGWRLLDRRIRAKYGGLRIY